jgi:hypothetical protein
MFSTIRYASGQRTTVFNTLLPALTSPLASEDYVRLSNSLSVSVGATKVALHRLALHRLRQRFAQTLREFVEKVFEMKNDFSMTNCPQWRQSLINGLREGCLFRMATELPSHRQGNHDASAPSVDELAASFPQFEIKRLIGRGGMGMIYHARQKNLERLR